MYVHMNIVATLLCHEEPVAEQVFRATGDGLAVRPDTSKPRRLPLATRAASAADKVQVTVYRSDIAEDEMTLSHAEWKEAESTRGAAWMADVLFRSEGLQAAWNKARTMGTAKTVAEAIANAAGGVPVFSL